LIAQIDARVGAEFANRADFMRAAARHHRDRLKEGSAYGRWISRFGSR
jgi:hypothetical protein